MAGHKKATALVVVIACMSICSARPLEPSILSPIAKGHNGGGGRLQRAVQRDDAVEIKGPYKRVAWIEVEMDDVMKSSSDLKFSKRLVPSGPLPIHNHASVPVQHKKSGSLKRSTQSEVKLDDVENFSKPLFSMLPKGSVPSRPSPIKNHGTIPPQHKQSGSLQRSAESEVKLDDNVKSFSKPLFSRIPKGPSDKRSD